MLLCVALLFPAQKPPAPSNLTIDFGEKSFNMFWDSVPGVAGYNVYTRPDIKTKIRTRINPILITSGPHFTYIWNMENGKRVRKIKGYSHMLSVTAVCSTNNAAVESAYSTELNNGYFDGFKKVTSWGAIAPVLRKSQACDTLPVPKHVNNGERFTAFIEGPGRITATLIKQAIDPLQEGGCEPISTMLITLLNEWDLYAYKIEGLFIREFHSFVVINVDNVEYVMDYAADQFVPDVSPVIFPRDFCFLDGKGKLAASGKPVYQVAKVISPEQSTLSDKQSSEVYRTIMTKVLASKK